VHESLTDCEKRPPLPPGVRSGAGAGFSLSPRAERVRRGA